MLGRRTLERSAQMILIVILVVAALGATLGASDPAARFDRDSRSLMCACGCNELLSACNHEGCPDSGPMLRQLAAMIARGDTDDSIFHQFQDQYGAAVLASPMFTRFNHFAWILPPLVLFLGIAGTLLIVCKWKFRPVPALQAARTPAEEAIRNRIRRETQL